MDSESLSSVTQSSFLFYLHFNWIWIKRAVSVLAGAVGHCHCQWLPWHSPLSVKERHFHLTRHLCMWTQNLTHHVSNVEWLNGMKIDQKAKQKCQTHCWKLAFSQPETNVQTFESDLCNHWKPKLPSSWVWSKQPIMPVFAEVLWEIKSKTWANRWPIVFAFLHEFEWKTKKIDSDSFWLSVSVFFCCCDFHNHVHCQKAKSFAWNVCALTVLVCPKFRNELGRFDFVSFWLSKSQKSNWHKSICSQHFVLTVKCFVSSMDALVLGLHFTMMISSLMNESRHWVESLLKPFAIFSQTSHFHFAFCGGRPTTPTVDPWPLEIVVRQRRLQQHTKAFVVVIAFFSSKPWSL